MEEITFSTDNELTLADIKEASVFVETFFAMVEDPDQIPASEENILWIQENIPDCVNLIKFNREVIGQTFIIPCTNEILNKFLGGKISENELFEEVKKKVTPSNFRSIYLCSALVREEFRNKGFAFEALKKSIKKVCTREQVKPSLFVDAWSEEGRNLARKVAKEMNLELRELK